MCGITGFVDQRAATSASDLRIQSRKMADAILHRGPDSEGYWEDAAAGVAFGHRRLAVIDLSEAGHQPMVSAAGRFVLVFNGEIYNFQDLKKQLVAEDPSWKFRGHSDTEIMLAAFEQWGVHKSLQQFNGMFAFALWDRFTRTLSLARDRMGEKPLYYTSQGSTFLFASELKALRAHPSFSADIDRSVLARYFSTNCVPGTSSIYEGVHKLSPGCLLEFPLKGNWHVAPFWTLGGAVRNSLANPVTGPEKEGIEELDILLHDSIRIRMLSDVPLGTFLSGGIDSSLITAIMQRESSRAVRTFSIGFEDAAFDESENALRVAKHLGTDHTQLTITAAEAQQVIPLLPQMYDEPFGDSSQIPTHLVARMARQHVTVALSGDGGDELFGGYNRHVFVPRIWRKARLVPRQVRRAFAAAVSVISPETWEKLFRFADGVIPDKANHRARGEKMQKVAGIIGAADPFEMYRCLVSHSQSSQPLVLGASTSGDSSGRSDWLRSLTIEEQMIFLDTANYLPDDMLVKIDRAAMSVSLETRIPFLDHRVVEFAWRLPLSWKIQDGKGKWILRRLLAKYLQTSLFERPKAGFAIPLAEWLRGPLRDWAESLLAEERLKREAFLDANAVRKNWSNFLRGGKNLQFHIWDVLMFQAWLESNRKNESLEMGAALAGGIR